MPEPDSSEEFEILSPRDQHNYGHGFGQGSREGLSYGSGGFEPFGPARSGGDFGIKDYIDMKHDSAINKMEASYERLWGELKTKAGKSDIWVAAGTIIGVMIAILAFGGDRFDGGVQVAGVSVEQAVIAAERSSANSAEIANISETLDVISQETRLISRNVFLLTGEMAGQSEDIEILMEHHIGQRNFPIQDRDDDE